MAKPALDESALRKTYDANLTTYKNLENEALFILSQCIERSGIKIHEIPSRVKKFDSFVDKAKRNQYSDPFKETNDVVGLRVICLFLSDISRIAEIIRANFDVLSEDNKIEGGEVSSFGYMSIHFIVTIKASHSGPRYDSIKSIPFEIQLRTLAMDAWANVSHYLDYKSDADVPKELRKDFYALSGLFYVADTHFQMFYKARQESLRNSEELVKKEKGLDQEINLDTLLAYLSQKLSDRKHANTKDLSGLLEELRAASYTRLSDIEKQVTRAWDAFLAYEKEKPPMEETKKIDRKIGEPTMKPTRYSDIGVIRACLEIADPNFRPVSQKYWREEYKKYKKMLKS